MNHAVVISFKRVNEERYTNDASENLELSEHHISALGMT
jgi:hypothetical protein